jgi:hypothetical protein
VGDGQVRDRQALLELAFKLGELARPFDRLEGFPVPVGDSCGVVASVFEAPQLV